MPEYTVCVRILRPLTAFVIGLVVLAGCGSDSSPSFTLGCTYHRLSGGLIRVNVTLKNTTSSTRSVYMYGPPLLGIRHMRPLLAPAPVTVSVKHSVHRYVGFLVSRAKADQTVRIVLRLISPRHGESIVASEHRTVRAASWSVLSNPNCVL
jgi:hypothetical protein